MRGGYLWGAGMTMLPPHGEELGVACGAGRGARDGEAYGT